MALQNGLYKVEFSTPLGQGNGVVVCEDGVLRGGDSLMYYVGAYKQDGDQFSAEVNVNRHSTHSQMGPVFGKDRVTIAISGTATETSANMTGTAAEAPGIKFGALLTKLQ